MWKCYWSSILKGANLNNRTEGEQTNYNNYASDDFKRSNISESTTVTPLNLRSLTARITSLQQLMSNRQTIDGSTPQLNQTAATSSREQYTSNVNRVQNSILSKSERAKTSVSRRSTVEATIQNQRATQTDSLPSTQPPNQSEEHIQNRKSFRQPLFSRDIQQSTISNQMIHSNTVPPKPAPRKTKACQVCFDEKPAASFTQRISRQCKHRERNICNTCIYEHIAQAFQKMCSDDVRCPELNCRIILDYEAIKKILQDARNIDLLQRYERFYLEHQLEQMPEFIWCTHACGSGQLAEQGDQNNIIRCVKCRKKSCFIHRVHWHEGLTCAKYDEQIDSGKRATDQWLAQHTKNCPKCRYGIEKTTGCDHMTCTQCHFEFCWACLAAYADIRSDGNHRHYQHCKHFRAYPK
ncbi:hypothetical protein I4U23_001370 [Adineta vaga]|nr:hypothetical protein I4U23_001370 [Adineta vaga]